MQCSYTPQRLRDSVWLVIYLRDDEHDDESGIGMNVEALGIDKEVRELEGLEALSHRPV